MDLGHMNIESRRKYSRTDTEKTNYSTESSGTSYEHSDTYSERMNSNDDIDMNRFETIMGWSSGDNSLFHGSTSSKQTVVDEEEFQRIEEQGEKLSLSSSSSNSSADDDKFQVDIKLPNFRPDITSCSSIEPVEGTSFRHHVSSNISSKTEECQIGYGGATSTSHGVFGVSSHELTVTESPEIQVMDRLGEFNPYRIPSSVFTRSKSITPADWSIASNESLFSIQVGNNSFSRDHIANLKSGELYKSGEFIAFSPSLVSPTVEPHRKSVESQRSEITLAVDHAAVKNKPDPSSEQADGQEPTHPVVVPWSSNISNSAGHSVNSEESFAFPIRNYKTKKKKKKKKQKKCACPFCSWLFCYCKWPSCSCRWPSCYCSKYSWAFCNGWNCRIKKWCCYFCTVSGDENNEFKKETKKQHEPATSSSTKASKSGWCKCWSLFPSCRCRWHCHCCHCRCCKCCY